MTPGLSGIWDDLHADGPLPGDDSRRRIVVVLLDTSFSMSLPAEEDHAADLALSRRIDVLNDRLRDWLPRLRAAGHEELRDVEVAVLTFGGEGVRAVTRAAPGLIGRPDEDDHVFVPAADLQLDDLEAAGTTHMVAAIGRALDLSEARARHLAERNVTVEPVRILMFGDGGTYDKDLAADAWGSLVGRLRALREQRRVQFVAFGPPDADEVALTELAGADGYLPLGGFDFELLLGLIFRATSADDPLAAVRREFGWGEPPP